MSKGIFTTEKIATAGMLIALSIVVNVFGVQITPSNQITFVHTISAISGVTLGPILGFIIGFLGSCIGFFINPTGAYNVLFDISAGLSGVIYGLAFTIYRKFIKNKSVIKLSITLIIAFIIVTTVCTAGINTVACYVLYSSKTNSFFVYLFARLPFQLLVSLINCILSTTIILTLNKVRLFNKLFSIE